MHERDLILQRVISVSDAASVAMAEVNEKAGCQQHQWPRFTPFPDNKSYDSPIPEMIWRRKGDGDIGVGFCNFA